MTDVEQYGMILRTNHEDTARKFDQLVKLGVASQSVPEAPKAKPKHDTAAAQQVADLGSDCLLIRDQVESIPCCQGNQSFRRYWCVLGRRQRCEFYVVVALT